MTIAPAGGWAYGLQLPIQTLTTTLAAPWEERASIGDLVTVVQKAETIGCAFAGVCDHIAIPDDDYARAMRTQWFDTVATIGFLAAHTSTIRLLANVWIPAYRHPLQTASSFGTLDRLSGGRVILGVGAGHVEGEFRALGVRYEERGAMLDEVLEALAGVWQDTYTSFDGRRWSWKDVAVDPRPASGRLTTWVGGSGARSWRRAGRYADGWIPMGNPIEQYDEIVATITAAAHDAGRDDVDIDIGFMPGRADLARRGEAERYAELIAAARAAGANVMYVKFGGDSLAAYLEQFDMFRDAVVPLVA